MPEVIYMQISVTGDKRIEIAMVYVSFKTRAWSEIYYQKRVDNNVGCLQSMMGKSKA